MIVDRIYLSTITVVNFEELKTEDLEKVKNMGGVLIVLKQDGSIYYYAPLKFHKPMRRLLQILGCKAKRLNKYVLRPNRRVKQWETKNN